MISKIKIIPEGNKIRPFIFFFISMISSLTFGQNAIDYFPSENGCVWKYDVYTLDNSNNIITATKSERNDSLIGQGNYKGKNATICLTNWDLYNNVIGTGYNDSVTYSFAGPIASEYNYLFTPPYKGEFVDLIVSEIRDKILGWFDLYQFDKPVNTEYEVLRYDTSIIYHVRSLDVNADITTRIIGKREADELVETSIGTFPSKKFTYNIDIDLIIYLQGNTYNIPFADFPVTHWISDDKWIIKEYRPTVTTTDLSEIQINPVTVPGLSRILSGFNYPKPGIPVLLSPQNNSSSISINQSLSWNESNYANLYHIQVATDSLFQNIVFDDSTISNTSIVINNLAYGTNYYWHVKAENSNEVSGWSDFWQLTTEIEDFLTVSPTNLNIAANGGSTSTFTVSSNINWTVGSNQTWLNVNPITGTENGSITLTATVNPTTTERTATITVSGEGVTSKSIVVTQAAGVATLSVSKTTLNINATEGSTATLNISSNTSWTLTSDQSWIAVNQTSGIGNATITFTAEKNQALTQRIATITISGSGITNKSITITQLEGSVMFALSTYTLTMNAVEGSNTTIDITSNSSWNIIFAPDWLNISLLSGTGNSSITITADINKTTDERTDSVIFTTPEGTTRILSVIQEAGSATISVSETKLNISGTANSSATFKISTNTSWTIISDQNWLSVHPESGTGDKTITITAEANKSGSERTAIVTISATGADPKTISVSQSSLTGSEMMKDQDVLVFPNPFIDGFFVKSTSGEIQVSVFNLIGENVYSNTVANNGFVPTSNFKNGIYLVNVICKGHSIQKTMIKK